MLSEMWKDVEICGKMLNEGDSKNEKMKFVLRFGEGAQVLGVDLLSPSSDKIEQCLKEKLERLVLPQRVCP